MRALIFTIVLLFLTALIHTTPSPPPDDPLAEIAKDPQSLSQLLQWSLANQDLDALHEKAEAVRRGDAQPQPPDGSNTLPAPTSEGAARAASVRPGVKPLTAERRAELNELAQSMMPDIVQLMRDALSNATDASLDISIREEALLELQDLVEDLDQARDFKTIGGFPEVIALLASEIAPIQAAAAWVLGSAVKNHRELQLHLLAERALPSLLVLLRSHADEEVRAKALYAASALLRNCPEAQAAFGRIDGVGTLLAVLAEGGSQRLVRKALVLVTDLLREQRAAAKASLPSKVEAADAASDGPSWLSEASDEVAGVAARAAADTPPRDEPPAGGGVDPYKAKVQFMVTNRMRTQLGTLGYSAEAIHQLDAESAATILREAGLGGGGSSDDEQAAVVGQVIDGSLWRNASELCGAIVDCMRMAEDVDAQEKAMLALEQLVGAGLTQGCSLSGVRDALRGYVSRCEAALAAAEEATSEEAAEEVAVGACEELLPTAREILGVMEDTVSAMGVPGMA